jgi:hypothetical protein
MNLVYDSCRLQTSVNETLDKTPGNCFRLLGFCAVVGMVNVELVMRVWGLYTVSQFTF